ncbi:MAG TPA: ATP-binding protein [Terracidiphilus sp.]|nr:ATP-binding protein [Terracidiphilus sp.]
MFSSAVVTPAAPTPVEEIAAALERIGPLHGLSFEERLWLARHGREAYANAGEILFEEGAPAEQMVLILKGEIHVRRQHGGPMALFIGRAGQMTGILPFSRMKSYGGQGFAVSPVWALLIDRKDFPAMLQAIPSMGQRSVTTLLDRVREVTRIEQQAEKLAALGKLAGNLAHELNNPASAAQRAAANLVEALEANRANRFKLVKLALSEGQIRAIEAWEEKVLTRPAPSPQSRPEPGALDYIAREEAIRGWLSATGCEGIWVIAPQLAEQGVTVADLNQYLTILGPAEACISLQFFARYLRSTRSAETLVNSTARIFDLIGAVKDYSNMDRAPILEVDVPAGLDATLQMLRSRMDHIEIERDYEPNLPRISAYGGELNQVWTALIENALDALGDALPAHTSSAAGRSRGTLRIACRMEAEMLLVEIWDSGPGIPPELQERIFEPFFTTKAPGRGLGLGLDYAMRIVRKHRGHLSVKSEPGSTCFRVRLPLDQLQAY